MHQELLQRVVDEEDVLVQPILLLMVLAHVLLRDEVQQEVYQVDAQVRVPDPPVQDHGDCARELHLKVHVRSEVDLSLDLLE